MLKIQTLMLQILKTAVIKLVFEFVFMLKKFVLFCNYIELIIGEFKNKISDIKNYLLFLYKVWASNITWVESSPVLGL